MAVAAGLTIADIHTLARFLVQSDSNNFTNAQLLILINKYYERIVGNVIAETMGGKWAFGDSNYTALPTATGNLVNAQQNYQLSGDFGSNGFNTTDQILNILGVEVLDNNSKWHPLTPITLQEILASGQGEADFHSTDGLPLYYQKFEDFIRLYPAPDNGVNVTLTNGLKIHFQRTADVFTSAEVTTGTKKPGFPSPWHDLLAYGPAYDFAIANGLPNANQLISEYLRKENELMGFVSKRDSDEPKVLRMGQSGYR